MRRRRMRRWCRARCESLAASAFSSTLSLLCETNPFSIPHHTTATLPHRVPASLSTQESAWRMEPNQCVPDTDNFISRYRHAHPLKRSNPKPAKHLGPDISLLSPKPRKCKRWDINLGTMWITLVQGSGMAAEARCERYMPPMHNTTKTVSCEFCLYKIRYWKQPSSNVDRLLKIMTSLNCTNLNSHVVLIKGI